VTGLIIILVGLWWFFGVGGLLGYLGPFLIFFGFVLLRLGLQRARFRSQGDGAGVVQIKEGQVAYFGPEVGGAVALSDLERLMLERNDGMPVWRLEAEGQQGLSIPVDARGAEGLFDAFARLPQLETERMLQELNAPSAPVVVIWERTPSRPMGTRLH
jgi:hypothetical protein